MTTEWTEYSYVYSVDSIAGKDSINFNVYCGDGLGVYDFDNISLSKESVAVRRPSGSAATRQSGHCTFSLPSDRVRVVPAAGASIDKIAVHSLKGRCLYSRILQGTVGRCCELSLTGGTWIVSVKSGHHEQRQKIVVP